MSPRSAVQAAVGCVGVTLVLAASIAAQRAPATKPSEREARLADRQSSRLNQEAADLFRNADTTFLVGDLNRAAEIFGKILLQYPNSTFVVRAQARLGDCGFEARKYVEAAAHYRRAAASADSASNEDEAAAGVRADYMVGLCYLQAKTYTQAFSQFRRFIDRHPGHPLVNQAYQAIGDAHLAMDQHQQALKAYRMVGTVIGERTAAHRRIAPGQRLYLRVTDADVNVGETPRNVSARIKTTSGDVEVVQLDPLGQRSALFLATIATALGVPRHSGELTEVFTEAAAAKIRAQLIDADNLERTAQAKAEEAVELDRSPQRTVDPAGTEKKRSALVVESQQLMIRAKALKAESAKAIDAAYAAFEKKIAEWAPDQALAAMEARFGKAPATAPTEDTEKAPGEEFRAAAAKPLGGADEDEPLAPPTATAAEADRRGMTENEILQVRRDVARRATNMENIDTRLTTLSVWSRLVLRQFQRLEVSGKDRIEIEYFDEVGPNGPNSRDKAIRKDVVEVASDALLSVLTPDGREALPQVVLNSSVLLRVEDFDGDVSNAPDTVTVVLAAVAPGAAGPATVPTTQRSVPGEIAPVETEVKKLPLVPPGAASVTVTLTETGSHTGVFEKLVRVDEKGTIGDRGAALALKTDQPGGLYALRAAYADARAVRNPDGWVLARALDCIGETGGEVAAVKYRQTPLDMEAKLRRAVAAGEIGKIYLDLGLTRRGREFLSSAQADCDEIARAGDATGLAEEALHHSWRIYFYAGLLDEAVASCRILMARYPKSEYIDDAMFAMGQASLERGEKQADADKSEGLKATLNRDLTRAIQQYEDLVKRFPQSPLAPEALFMVGRAKMAAGQTGLDVFERLAKQYPDSVLAARGLVKAAEYYMQISDHRRALDYFGRVLVDYPDAPNLGEVLLNRGMCQKQLGQKTEALQTFYRVVEEQSGTELAAKAQKQINFINQQRGGKDE